MFKLLPFQASEIKVAWAQNHIGRLEQEIAKWHRPGPVPVPISADRRIQPIHHPFNMCIPLAIGDAAHNLRTALDLLAIDVVKLNEGNASGVYFPFAKSEAELDEQIVSKKFNRAAPAAIDLLRSFRPYPEGNKVLRGLHDLDVADKHRIIVPSDHRVMLSFYTGPDGTPTANSQSGELLFSYDPQILDLMPVMPTLREMANVVSHCVKSFADLLGRDGNNNPT